jgi:putative transposase
MDLTSAQVAICAGSVDVSRWAYNYALERKMVAYEAFVQVRRQSALDLGIDLEDRAALAKLNRTAMKITGGIPDYTTNLAVWRSERGDASIGLGGVCVWWREGLSRVFASGMQDADAAFKNFFDSLGGRRAGRRVGPPRFKKRSRSRDSFRMAHDVHRPGICGRRSKTGRFHRLKSERFWVA